MLKLVLLCDFAVVQKCIVAWQSFDSALFLWTLFHFGPTKRIRQFVHKSIRWIAPRWADFFPPRRVCWFRVHNWTNTSLGFIQRNHLWVFFIVAFGLMRWFSIRRLKHAKPSAKCHCKASEREQETFSQHELKGVEGDVASVSGKWIERDWNYSLWLCVFLELSVTQIVEKKNLVDFVSSNSGRFKSSLGKNKKGKVHFVIENQRQRLILIGVNQF